MRLMLLKISVSLHSVKTSEDMAIVGRKIDS